MATTTHADPPPPIIKEPSVFKYISGTLLGKGGFAICHRAEVVQNNRRTGHMVALKIVRSEMPFQKLAQKFVTELQLHSKMQHPNIVEFFRAFAYGENTYVALEICERGSLADVLRRRKYITMPEIRRFLIQTCGAVKYLHTRHIVHRDLKTGNLFLDRYMNVKVGDFGLAAMLVSKNDIGHRRTTMCGTPNYLAPEILEKSGRGHNEKVDIWAIGIIAYTLAVGRAPFHAQKREEIYKKLQSRDYRWPTEGETSNEISPELCDLVGSLLVHEDDRPAPDKIVSHPFFMLEYVPERLDTSCTHKPPVFKIPAKSAKELEYGFSSSWFTMCRASGVGELPDGRCFPVYGGKRMPSIVKECEREVELGQHPIIPFPDDVVYEPYPLRPNLFHPPDSETFLGEEAALQETSTNDPSRSRHADQETAVRSSKENADPGSRAVPPTKSSRRPPAPPADPWAGRNSARPTQELTNQPLPHQRVDSSNDAATSARLPRPPAKQRQSRLVEGADDLASRMKALSTTNARKPEEEEEKKSGRQAERKRDGIRSKLQGIMSGSGSRSRSRSESGSEQTSGRAIPTPAHTPGLAPQSGVAVSVPSNISSAAPTPPPHDRREEREAGQMPDSAGLPPSTLPSSNLPMSTLPSSSLSNAVYPSGSVQTNGSGLVPSSLPAKNSRQDSANSCDSKASSNVNLPDTNSSRATTEEEGPEMVKIPKSDTESVMLRIMMLRESLMQMLNTDPKTIGGMVRSRYLPYVSKWIDYSKRDGVGYVLEDGTVGCIQNASNPQPVQFTVVRNGYNKLLEIRRDPKAIETIPLEYFADFGKHGVRSVHIPAHRRKTVCVCWKRFGTFMFQKLLAQQANIPVKPKMRKTEDGKEVPVVEEEEEELVGGPFVRFYQRLGNVGIWGFDDGTFQFNFPDHTKLVISADGVNCNFLCLSMRGIREVQRKGTITADLIQEREMLPMTVLSLLSEQAMSHPQGSLAHENMFRQKLHFIVRVLDEWIGMSGMGKLSPEAKHLQWSGRQIMDGMNRLDWSTVGASGGDEERYSVTITPEEKKEVAVPVGSAVVPVPGG